MEKRLLSPPLRSSWGQSDTVRNGRLCNLTEWSCARLKARVSCGTGNALAWMLPRTIVQYSDSPHEVPSGLSAHTRSGKSEPRTCTYCRGIIPDEG